MGIEFVGWPVRGEGGHLLGPRFLACAISYVIELVH